MDRTSTYPTKPQPTYAHSLSPTAAPFPNLLSLTYIVRCCGNYAPAATRLAEFRTRRPESKASAKRFELCPLTTSPHSFICAPRCIAFPTTPAAGPPAPLCRASAPCLVLLSSAALKRRQMRCFRGSSRDGPGSARTCSWIWRDTRKPRSHMRTDLCSPKRYRTEDTDDTN